LILAGSQDITRIGLTLGLYVAVQQVEANLLIPLVQRKTVKLPPALTLLALVAFGVLFGGLGVVLAMPLTVLAFVAVRELWVDRNEAASSGSQAQPGEGRTRSEGPFPEAKGGGAAGKEDVTRC
jgi:predicted PurR-regulated permease PerM